MYAREGLVEGGLEHIIIIIIIFNLEGNLKLKEMKNEEGLKHVKKEYDTLKRKTPFRPLPSSDPPSLPTRSLTKGVTGFRFLSRQKTWIGRI